MQHTLIRNQISHVKEKTQAQGRSGTTVRRGELGSYSTCTEYVANVLRSEMSSNKKETR
jgi:hypothetical protein